VERESGIYEFCEITRPRVTILFACALESAGWRSGEASGIGACAAGATICNVGTTLSFSDVELMGGKTCKSEFMSVTSVEKSRKRRKGTFRTAITKPAVTQVSTEISNAEPTKIEVFFNHTKKIPLSKITLHYLNKVEARLWY
jgi:hypothetical protein